MFYRQAWEEIDLDNLDFNFQYIQKKIGDKQIIAVIKANAYGVGDYQVALRAIANHAVYLAVSSLDEAITLRYKGIDHPILVLSYVSPKQLLAAKQNHITLTLTSLDHAQAIKATGITGLKFHVKIDTGMNRIGFKNFDAVQQAIDLLHDDQDIEGIFTHYLDSGIADNPVTEQQYATFRSIVTSLNFPFRLIHTENSDAIVNFNDDISNAARAGIAMYGISSFPTELKPVCALYAKIIHIKQVPQGETISYSGTYTTPCDQWIATIPIGYADGLLRSNQDRRVYVAGSYGRLVGRICMDQCMINVDQAYPLDTIVELFGPHIPLMEVADYTKTIPYEILTSISDRITRVYRRKLKVIAIENNRLDHVVD